jgi:hypothetical protein
MVCSPHVAAAAVAGDLNPAGGISNVSEELLQGGLGKVTCRLMDWG